MNLNDDIKDALHHPFPVNQIHWRLGAYGKGQNGWWGRALAYIDARSVMDRLDEVFGLLWEDYIDYHKGGEIHCSISITMNTGDESIRTSRTGVAERTDFEGVKGGASDAFKRAAVKYGIGRYLYRLPEMWVDLVPKSDVPFADRRTNAWQTTPVKDRDKTIYMCYQTPQLPDWALPYRRQ